MRQIDICKPQTVTVLGQRQIFRIRDGHTALVSLHSNFAATIKIIVHERGTASASPMSAIRDGGAKHLRCTERIISAHIVVFLEVSGKDGSHHIPFNMSWIMLSVQRQDLLPQSESPKSPQHLEQVNLMVDDKVTPIAVQHTRS